MAHKCPHCGAILPEESSFCPYCAQGIRDRQPARAPTHLWRKGLKWIVPLLAAVLVCALIFRPSKTTAVVFQEDKNGMVRVTPDQLREVFPMLTGINFTTTATTSDNIDDYLIETFQMANLVASRGAAGTDEEWGMFNARSAGTRVCLLLYDRNTHLMGYFIGEPLQVSEGQWQMDVVTCDYDFTQLYEAQLAAFEDSWQTDFSTYLPPEEIPSSGAVWFLSGYDTGKGPVLRADDPQLYHLWAALHGPEVERQCREMERLEEFLPSEGRWRCYLLLDRDYNLLGYTMLDYQGNGG